MKKLLPICGAMFALGAGMFVAYKCMMGKTNNCMTKDCTKDNCSCED